MSRLLALLVSGPFSKQQSFCEALLVVEAGHAASGFHAAETGSQTGVDRAREAAKKLLAAQRGNLGMWAAYAGLESQARQYKVGPPHAKNHSDVQRMQITLHRYCHHVYVLYSSTNQCIPSVSMAQLMREAVARKCSWVLALNTGISKAKNLQ